MANAAPIFAFEVRYVIELILLVFALIIQGVALVHAITQRSDAFPAIGTLPKGGWIAILAVCLVLTLLGFGPISLFGLIGIAAALIYLLDVRVGLRDLSDGKGSGERFSLAAPTRQRAPHLGARAGWAAYRPAGAAGAGDRAGHHPTRRTAGAAGHRHR